MTMSRETIQNKMQNQTEQIEVQRKHI
jgi:hypothetical protein